MWQVVHPLTACGLCAALQELAEHISAIRTTVNSELTVWVDEAKAAKAAVKGPAASNQNSQKKKGKRRNNGDDASTTASKKPCADE